MLNQSSISQSQHPKLTKILSPQSLTIEPTIRERVKQKLTQDAEFLLDKKRRQEEKRERVRLMEERLEKERLNKIKVLEEKEAKSEVVREKNREVQSKKFKEKSDQFSKIVSKIGHKNQQQIEKALSMQKQLQNSYHSKSFSKTSKDNTIGSARNHSVRLQMENVQDKISLIMNKANKAKQHHQEHKKLLVERIKQKTKSIGQAQRRAHHHSLVEESEMLKNYYEKEQEMQRAAQYSKTENEKRLLEKRKSVKEKLDKCSENLKYLTNKQEQKYQELQIKFSKKTEPKQWKDVRLEKYKQKWQQNSKKIQYQKEQKARQILQKHQQITQQQKLYKEQKDKLIQAVKHT